jgi:hypothetical protein
MFFHRKDRFVIALTYVVTSQWVQDVQLAADGSEVATRRPMVRLAHDEKREKYAWFRSILSWDPECIGLSRPDG